jgi:hypothetical protein
MMNLYVVHGVGYSRELTQSKIFLAQTKETACVLYYMDQDNTYPPVQLIVELLAGQDHTIPGEEE